MNPRLSFEWVTGVLRGAAGCFGGAAPGRGVKGARTRGEANPKQTLDAVTRQMRSEMAVLAALCGHGHAVQRPSLLGWSRAPLAASSDIGTHSIFSRAL